MCATTVYPLRQRDLAIGSALVAACILLPMMANPATSATLSGKADVIDADTIKINGIPIRLYGIDAPEGRQTCQRDGRSYPCGKQSIKWLVDLIAGKPVHCELLERDDFGRFLAVCSVDDVELNAAMVSQGWALAFVKYSNRYVPQQKRAEMANLGLWAGSFITPWDWRSGQAESAQRTGSCVIKGNINRRGERIYHLPFQQFYRRTQIDVEKGERWFCTEDEAGSAG